MSLISTRYFKAVRLKEKIPLGFDAAPRVASEEDEVLRKENA